MSKHPQDMPLSDWPQGWLTLQVAYHVGAEYISMHEHEKQSKGLPVTRKEMIDYLVEQGDTPRAGV